jgi:hypothetical protein
MTELGRATRKPRHGRPQGVAPAARWRQPVPCRQPAGPQTMGPVFPTFCVGRYLTKSGSRGRCHSARRYSARRDRTGWTTRPTWAAGSAWANTPWTFARCFVTCCHVRSAFLRQSLFTLPGRCFRLVINQGEAGPPTAASRWPGAASGGPERPPLPDRGLRGPPAATGRGQRHAHLASRQVVAADA